jgi:hypothetical protein
MIVPHTHFVLPMTYIDSDGIGLTTADAAVRAGHFAEP